LGLFVEHLVGAPKIKGLETPFKQTQPPAKIAHNHYPINGAQSKSGFVPKISKKKWKRWGELVKNGFWAKNGKSGENEQIGSRRWVKWPDRDRRWYGGGGFVMGDGDFGY
jgi:hypothetical protein